MPSPFPSANDKPSFLRETSSGDVDSIWEGEIVDVWRAMANQWQAYIVNNRGESRELVITRVFQQADNMPDTIDFAEFGLLSPTSVTQQYWMGISSDRWVDDDVGRPTQGFFHVHAKGLEISGQRRWEANFLLPKAYQPPAHPERTSPHQPA